LHQKIVETQKEKNELQKSTNFETFSKIRYWVQFRSISHIQYFFWKS
jgi:hypothetical protein